MEKERARILVACAGWSLSSAVAAEFTGSGSHLERYASVLPAVEINSSFYRPHRPATYARWHDSVPDGFRFSVKIPRTISHELRLRDSEALLDDFLAQAGNLGKKLGCLLLQLPPSLRFDAAEATSFFGALRDRTRVAVACEPRHVSWFGQEAADVMQRYKVSFVHADPPPVPEAPPNLPGIVYLRLHGSPEIYRSAYDDAFLESLAHRIEHAAAKAKQVWCVFDNTANGHAVPNALILLGLLQQADDRRAKPARSHRNDT
jgi:uncharacterized protein YecE (DUF72 family)